MRFILPRFFINCERWKWNDDLRVYVSTHGHIKDEHKKNIAAKINNSGYFMVAINHKLYSVHRLVLMTWRPLPNDGEPMTVDHLDSNRRNNHLENLEWVSREENLKRANENLIQVKEVKCDNCVNYAPKQYASVKLEALGPLVTWNDLKEKYDLYQNKVPGQYYPDGLFEKLSELWENGEVKIYKGSTHTEITKEKLMEAIGNQPNAEIMIERFLKCSLIRTGKYLGWKPWMRWKI